MLHSYVEGGDERGDSVTAIAFSPDSRILAAGGHSREPRSSFPKVGQIRLWDVQTGKVLRVLTDEGMADVTRIAFSADRKTVIAGCYDGFLGEMKGSIRFWNADSGQLLRQLKWPQGIPVGSLAVSGDGRYLAVGSLPYGDGKTYVGLRVWDIREDTAQLVLEAEWGTVITAVAFSPDNTCLFVGRHDGTTDIWDTHQWTVLQELKGGGGGHWPVAVCPSTRNHLMAISHGEDVNEVVVWDYSKNRCLRTIAGIRHVDGMDFSPDGDWLAVGGDPVINVPGFAKNPPEDGGTYVDIWEVASGKLLLTLQTDCHASSPRISFSPSGEFLACCTDTPTLFVWQFPRKCIDPRTLGWKGTVRNARCPIWHKKRASRLWLRSEKRRSGEGRSGDTIRNSFRNGG
jgi:WD40 repeat protein